MFGSINGLELNNLSELMILIPNLHDFIGSNTPSYLMKKTEKSPIYIQFKSKSISIICLIQWEEPLTDNPRTSNMFEKESGRKKNGLHAGEKERERDLHTKPITNVEMLMTLIQPVSVIIIWDPSS
jgi:hypothetical protein